MNKNQLLKRIGFALFAGLVTLSGASCSKNNPGINGTQSGLGGQLVADTVSRAPLVNGVPASYSVYVKNIGTTEVKCLSFVISDASNVKIIKSGASLKDQTIPTIDSGNCSKIEANSSCKINITTGSIGTLELNGMLDGLKHREIIVADFRDRVVKNDLYYLHGDEARKIILTVNIYLLT